MPNDNTKKFNPVKKIEKRFESRFKEGFKNKNFENLNLNIEKKEIKKNVPEEKTGIKKIEEQLLKEDVGMQNTGIVDATNQNQRLAKRKEKIEKVLEENLGDLYLSMPPEKRREFKIIGEQTAAKINLLMEKTKFKVKEIINLIKYWLSFIPGINKYFLEQEAKIKTDRIIKIKNNE